MIAPASVRRALARLIILIVRHNMGQQLLHALEVAAEQLRDLHRGHMVPRIIEPAVIVGCYTDHAVAELRLHGQKDLRNGRHANEIRAAIAQEVALGPGSEARPFNDGVGLFLVNRQLQRTR